MITTTWTEQLNGGVCAPASSVEFVRYRGLEGRHVAPISAPATGEVRPQTGDSSLIAAAPKGMGTAWGRTWRPPD